MMLRVVPPLALACHRSRCSCFAVIGFDIAKLVFQVPRVCLLPVMVIGCPRSRSREGRCSRHPAGPSVEAGEMRAGLAGPSQQRHAQQTADLGGMRQGLIAVQPTTAIAMARVGGKPCV